MCDVPWSNREVSYHGIILQHFPLFLPREVTVDCQQYDGSDNNKQTIRVRA